MANYAPLVRKALREAGWRHERPGKGDHEIWGNAKDNRKLIGKILSRHTANAIVKQAGLPKRF